MFLAGGFESDNSFFFCLSIKIQTCWLKTEENKSRQLALLRMPLNGEPLGRRNPLNLK